MVTFSCNHLRRCITRTSAGRFKRFSVFVGVGKAKVNYLDVVFIVKKEILRLQIPVTDAHFVDVLHTRDNLLEEFARFALLEPLAFHDIVKELAPSCILHDEEKLLRCFDNLI